jgi:hypothetical protein
MPSMLHLGPGLRLLETSLRHPVLLTNTVRECLGQCAACVHACMHVMYADALYAHACVCAHVCVSIMPDVTGAAQPCDYQCVCVCVMQPEQNLTCMICDMLCVSDVSCVHVMC